jgi:hypothetical protein
MVEIDANSKMVRRKQFDWITAGIAGLFLTIDLAVVPTLAYWDAHVSKVIIPAPHNPLLALGLTLVLPALLIYIFAARVSDRLLDNKALAWCAALVAFGVLVTAHWAAICVLGHADTDNAAAHSLIIAVFLSYILGVVFSIFWGVLLALRAVS